MCVCVGVCVVMCMLKNKFISLSSVSADSSPTVQGFDGLCCVGVQAHHAQRG